MTRMSSAERKKRLTAATLEVVGREGVEGATTARIAEAAAQAPAMIDSKCG